MDKLIYVSPPDLEARADMFKMYLMNRPCEPVMNYELLAKLSDRYTCSDIEYVTAQAARNTVKSNADVITQDMVLKIVNVYQPSLSEKDIEEYSKFKNLERE